LPKDAEEKIECHLGDFDPNHEPNTKLDKEFSDKYYERIKNIHPNSSIETNLETGEITIHEYNEVIGEYEKGYKL